MRLAWDLSTTPHNTFLFDLFSLRKKYKSLRLRGLDSNQRQPYESDGLMRPTSWTTTLPRNISAEGRIWTGDVYIRPYESLVFGQLDNTSANLVVFQSYREDGCTRSKTRRGIFIPTAEEEGFEPPTRINETGFQDRSGQPLRFTLPFCYSIRTRTWTSIICPMTQNHLCYQLHYGVVFNFYGYYDGARTRKDQIHNLACLPIPPHSTSYIV